MKKQTHGGKRKGAGRPKTKEDTKVMRVPVSKVEAVVNLIKPDKSCPNCLSSDIIMFTSDLDLCNHCGQRF